ncbi:MAG: metallophosphatase [Bacteroidota bacterium]
MKRSTFIKTSLATASYMGLGGLTMSSTASDHTKKITILHTNDVHSHIDPFGPNDGRNANKGGIARRAALISSLKAENPNTLLLDAGDIFQGTPYFNYYGGELEFKLMSMLDYDAATIGNHDFDNGINGLLAQLPHAKFDFLSANYDFSNTALDGLINPCKVFIKDDIKIGVFGLGIKLEGLVNKKMYKETRYLNPIEISEDMSFKLRHQEKCDLVICLSHLGYNYKNPYIMSDLQLARSTKDIDLIIGGHTHTFLEEPTEETNSAGKPVLINQVGCYGLYLGKVDFYFSRNSQKSTHGTSLII